jgi:hypothetical protein
MVQVCFKITNMIHGERVPGGQWHPGPEREQHAGGLPGLVRLELDGEG